MNSDFSYFLTLGKLYEITHPKGIIPVKVIDKRNLPFPDNEINDASYMSSGELELYLDDFIEDTNAIFLAVRKEEVIIEVCHFSDWGDMESESCIGKLDSEGVFYIMGRCGVIKSEWKNGF